MQVTRHQSLPHRSGGGRRDRTRHENLSEARRAFRARLRKPCPTGDSQVDLGISARRTVGGGWEDAQVQTSAEQEGTVLHADLDSFFA
ncbi:hypothetical protein, partial [Aeromicrobium sp.]|uniref:hypothetical protein n=1 Tax=Aeromicrobium sp. TaxID=1871063 RepID=UPI003512FE5F